MNELKAEFLRLGFSESDISDFMGLMELCNNKITVNKLIYFGVDNSRARLFKYMYDIATGSTSIETDEEMSKHLKKMSGGHKVVTVENLGLSKVREVPRVCVVAGIKKEPYVIYNSNQYKKRDMLYVVSAITSANVVVMTKRKPKIAYKSGMKTDEVEIKGINDKGVVTVAFKKNYCKLCNRFIVVVSLRKPEFHHGMIEVLCKDGTRVYIYAQTVKSSSNLKYNYTQRIYSYGVFESEIKDKLIKALNEVYNNVYGYKYRFVDSNMPYSVLSTEERV